MCVSSAYRCDNQNDCPLGDDEDNCGLNFTIMHVAIPCLAEEFECEDKMCIPRALVCDGLNHCLDGKCENLIITRMYQF